MRGRRVMFSSAVRWGKRLKDWKTIPTSSRILRMSDVRSVTWSSSTQISPEVRFSSRLMQRSIVLLPLPEGPMTSTTSPGLTERLAFFSATTLPKFLQALMIRTLSATAVHPFFHERDEPGEEQRHDEVDQRDDGEGLEVVEGLGRVLPSAPQEIGDGEDGDEGGVLQQGDELVAQRREDDPDGLGKDDPAAAPGPA